MKSGKSWWKPIIWIIGESIWVIELAVELYTGEMTTADLISILAFCTITTAVIFYFLKRKKRNRG